MKMRYPLAAIAAAVLLSGCVIAVDPDNHKHRSHGSDTALTMAQTPLGSSVDQVIERLDRPERVEVFQRAAGEYRILIYRHGDQNSLTPMVFLNDKLQGIGQLAVEAAYQAPGSQAN